MSEQPEFWTQPEGGERIPMERDPEGNLIGPPGVSHVYVGTSTLTVTDFVLARIAEDEARATRASSSAWPVVANAAAGCSVVAGWHVLDHSPARVLAQCAAMRKIVEGHSGLDSSETPNTHCEWCGDGDGGYCPVPYPCDTVLTLASIWSDHPDWREEWR